LLVHIQAAYTASRQTYGAPPIHHELRVGLTEIDDGEWDVYFGPLRLGRFHERTLTIEDVRGRQYRRPYQPPEVLPMSLDCFVTHVLDRSLGGPTGPYQRLT
jgi:hypothetical protein